MTLKRVKSATGNFTCIIFQSRKNYLEDQYQLLTPEQRELPRIYLEHDPPREVPTDTKHVVDDPEVLLVHVTHFNNLMWDKVKEFSQYDAGWLHFFSSRNEGELMRANWDDLNYPARMATLAAAGLPMLQRDNTGHTVATQTLVRDMNLGVFFTDMAGLHAQLADRPNMQKLRENVWHQRLHFCFDHHADDLTAYFHRVISRKFAGQAMTV